MNEKQQEEQANKDEIDESIIEVHDGIVTDISDPIPHVDKKDEKIPYTIESRRGNFECLKWIFRVIL